MYTLETSMIVEVLGLQSFKWDRSTQMGGVQSGPILAFESNYGANQQKEDLSISLYLSNKMKINLFFKKINQMSQRQTQSTQQYLASSGSLLRGPNSKSRDRQSCQEPGILCGCPLWLEGTQALR